MNFLIDAQLPPALAHWISSRGHQATHVIDAGLQAADDDPIWEHARSTKAVIISEDEDFVDRWQLARHVPTKPCSMSKSVTSPFRSDALY